MINLEKKKVLLTGASGGIGKAIAIELASLGADICLTGRNEEELTKLKNCLLYTSPSPRDHQPSRMPSSA